jgi:Secretion system C-terminal sorting domain
MKKLLTLFSMAFALASNAQIKYYTDTTYLEPFVRLQGGINATAGKVWDDPQYIAPIGFNFKYFNDSTNALYSDSNFSIGTNLSLYPVNQFSTNLSFIVFSSIDIIDKGFNTNISKSPTTYKTVGVAPNRQFILEIRNAGINDTVAVADSLDLQLVLNEKDNSIEMHHGNVYMPTPVAIATPDGVGPFYGLINKFNILTQTIANIYYLVNDPMAPDLDSNKTIFNGNTLPGLDTFAENNRVYKFIPVKNIVTPASVSNKILFNNIGFYYSNNTITLQNLSSQNVAMQVVNMQGQVILTSTISSGKSNFDASGFTNGMYILKIKGLDGDMSFKFVK